MPLEQIQGRIPQSKHTGQRLGEDFWRTEKKTGKYISDFNFYCKMQALNLIGRYLSKN